MLKGFNIGIERNIYFIYICDYIKETRCGHVDLVQSVYHDIILLTAHIELSN